MTTTTATIQQGDWVTLPKNAQGTAWDAGHVEYITKGQLAIGFGGRETTSDYWLHSAVRYERPEDVGEVWRRFNVVRHNSFVFQGRTVPVTSLEYEWRRIA